MEGATKVIVLGGDIDGLLESDRISADESGKCSLKIESVTEEHFGTWACTLVDHAGHLFAGQIELNMKDSEWGKFRPVRAVSTCSLVVAWISEIQPTVYFGTSTGLQTYSVCDMKVVT